MKVKSESEVAQSFDSSRPHGLQPTRLLRPWDFPGKSTGVGAIAFSAFGLETANKHTVHWWFKKFSKGGESLEDERSFQPSEVDNDQLRAIIEADPLTTT